MKTYSILWWHILFSNGTKDILRCSYDNLYTYSFKIMDITADNRFEAVKKFKEDEPDIKSIIIYHDIDKVWYDETAEVKRFVLLEDKTVVGTKDSRLFHIAENILCNNNRPQGSILKQSDNLIDLAEIGDMVEIVDEQGLDYIHLTEKWTVSEIREDFVIIAIWKRNGDIMRRYER